MCASDALMRDESFAGAACDEACADYCAGAVSVVCVLLVIRRVYTAADKVICIGPFYSDSMPSRFRIESYQSIEETWMGHVMTRM